MASGSYSRYLGVSWTFQEFLLAGLNSSQMYLERFFQANKMGDKIWVKKLFNQIENSTIQKLLNDQEKWYLKAEGMFSFIAIT